MASKQRQRVGCGFLISTCLLTCLMLVFNGAMVMSLYYWLAPLGPRILRHPQAFQFLLFSTPVLLLFVEWRMIDSFVDRTSAWRSESKHK